MDEFIQKIESRKKFAYMFFLLLGAVMAAAFFAATAQETIAMGRDLLGEQTYRSRMKDSYLYSFAMIALVLPLLIPVKRFFDRYPPVVRSLMGSEMDMLLEQNRSAPFFNKYLPGFIVKNRSVTFFKFFGITEIQFSDIQSIGISPMRGGYFLTVKMNSGSFRAVVAETLPNVRKMIAVAKQANSNIAVKE